jgi:hypothetical protein
VGDVTVTRTRLMLDDTWSVPVIEFVGSQPSGTTLVFGDAGRAKLASEIDGLLRRQHRVVAFDPWYFGESKIEIRDFLYGLLVSALGERPLGIQAGQVAAVARWLKQQHVDVSVAAFGPRASLIAQVAAAADPQAISNLYLTGAMASLREPIDRDMSTVDAPELFCFGLLEFFDVSQLKALALRQ